MVKQNFGFDDDFIGGKTFKSFDDLGLSAKRSRKKRKKKSKNRKGK